MTAAIKAMCAICIALNIISAVMYAKDVFEPTKRSAVSGEFLRALLWLALLLK